MINPSLSVKLENSILIFMKFTSIALFLFCFLISACGDSASPSIVNADDISQGYSSEAMLSSEALSSAKQSSSSKKAISSSSRLSSEKAKSSSSVAASSSSKQSSTSKNISSSSAKNSSSSIKVSSSSARATSSSSSPASSESSPKVSSSSVAALSSEAASSSSLFFEPPKGSVSIPKTVTFEEVYANAKESLLQNFFAQDSIEIEYTMEMSKISSYKNEVKYISNGKNHLYLSLSNEVSVMEPISVALKLQNKPTLRIVRDSVRKVVLLSDTKNQKEKESFILNTSERYKDSLRTEYGVVIPFMLDSGAWQQPVQITDELFEIKNDLGYTAYYNLSKKVIEMIHMIATDENDVTAETVVRYYYGDDGYVNVYTADVESRKSGRTAGASVKTEIKTRKSGIVIPAELFDF